MTCLILCIVGIIEDIEGILPISRISWGLSGRTDPARGLEGWTADAAGLEEPLV